MRKQHKSPKIKKFTKKDNICNICQNTGTLSEDHVPPKVCPPAKDRVIDNILYQIIGYKGFKPRYSQNGVSYKTICRDCNSKLGRDYDRYLGEFSKKIEQFVESKIILPDFFEVECYPNAIMRSVLGHLLTAKTETDGAVIDSLIRPCILDSSLPIPDDIHIFYWVYPHEKTILLRDFAMPSIRGKFDSVGLFNMIKFYPIAFLITYQLDKYEGLSSLHKFNRFLPQDKASIKIDLNSCRRDTWPEEVDSTNCLAFSPSANDAVISWPNGKKRPRHQTSRIGSHGLAAFSRFP